MVLQALRSVVGNEAVQLEPYLHQIMPFILTCMVGKRLGVCFWCSDGACTTAVSL